MTTTITKTFSGQWIEFEVERTSEGIRIVKETLLEAMQMNYHKDLEKLRMICDEIQNPHDALAWLEDGESLALFGITDDEAVQEIYHEIRDEINSKWGADS
jgi:hypothetical protein